MTLIPAVLSAAWLGIVTAVMPCPLATNIAAVSFLARRAWIRVSSNLSKKDFRFGRLVRLS